MNPRLSEEWLGNAHEPGFGGEAGAALAAALRSFPGMDPDPSEETLCCKGTSGCSPVACRGRVVPMVALPGCSHHSPTHGARELGSAGSPRPGSISPLTARLLQGARAHPQPRAVNSGFWNGTSGSHPDLGPVAGGSITAPFLAGTKATSLLPPRQRRALLPCSPGPAALPTLTHKTDILHGQSINFPAFCH